jgi:hypothetical protein
VGTDRKNVRLWVGTPAQYHSQTFALTISN